jgi:hypothetical protein
MSHKLSLCFCFPEYISPEGDLYSDELGQEVKRPTSMRLGPLSRRVVFGIPVTLIDPEHPQRFFARENMYDYEDDFER